MPQYLPSLSFLLLLLLGHCPTAARAADATTARLGIGYRYDVSGVYPRTDPPLVWRNGWTRTGRGRKAGWVHDGDETGLRWRAPLPNWSSGGPIVVADRVVVLSEPTGYAPIIQCYDADAGDLLWEDEIDPLAVLPDGEALRSEWADLWQRSRELMRLRAAQKAIVDQPEGPEREAARASWRERAAALGVTSMEFKKYSRIRIDGSAIDPATSKRVERLHDRGLYFMRHNVGVHGKYLERGTWTGYTYPTPVSDGDLVYALTGYNTVACYDLATGAQHWQRWLGPPVGRKVLQGKAWHDASFYPSPILVDGVLVVSNPAHLIGIDAASGEERWRVDSPRGANGLHYFSATPLPLIIDDTAYVFYTDSILYRVADGKAMSQRYGRLHRNHTPAARGSTVAVMRVEGERRQRRHFAELIDFAAVLDGTATDGRPTVQWSTSYGAETYIDHFWDEHLLLLATHRFAPATGENLGELADRVRYSGIGWLRAGDHYFVGSGMADGPALRLQVFDRQGKRTQQIDLRLEPPSPERREHIRGEIGDDHWGMFGNGTPFFTGGRVYVRSFDHLYCFEK